MVSSQEILFTRDDKKTLCVNITNLEDERDMKIKLPLHITKNDIGKICKLSLHIDTKLDDVKMEIITLTEKVLFTTIINTDKMREMEHEFRIDDRMIFLIFKTDKNAKKKMNYLLSNDITIQIAKDHKKHRKTNDSQQREIDIPEVKELPSKTIKDESVVDLIEHVKNYDEKMIEYSNANEFIVDLKKRLEKIMNSSNERITNSVEIRKLKDVLVDRISKTNRIIRDYNSTLRDIKRKQTEVNCDIFINKDDIENIKKEHESYIRNTEVLKNFTTKLKKDIEENEYNYERCAKLNEQLIEDMTRLQREKTDLCNDIYNEERILDTLNEKKRSIEKIREYIKDEKETLQRELERLDKKDIEATERMKKVYVSIKDCSTKIENIKKIEDEKFKELDFKKKERMKVSTRSGKIDETLSIMKNELMLKEENIARNEGVISMYAKYIETFLSKSD